MNIDSIAMWLGYGVMLAGGLFLLSAMLFVVFTANCAIVSRTSKALARIYDLKTLRAPMRQLEAEGKVSKKPGVKP